MVRFLVFVGACLLTAGCAGYADNGPAARPRDALDVYETVFRYRLERQAGDIKAADLQAYLSVDGKDPPAELLKRLSKDWPNLKPASEESKEKGLRVYVDNLKWTARGAAELKAGYWFPTKFAGEGYAADHHIIRNNGRWVVEKVTNEISS